VEALFWVADQPIQILLPTQTFFTLPEGCPRSTWILCLMEMLFSLQG